MEGHHNRARIGPFFGSITTDRRQHTEHRRIPQRVHSTTSRTSSIAVLHEDGEHGVFCRFGTPGSSDRHDGRCDGTVRHRATQHRHHRNTGSLPGVGNRTPAPGECCRRSRMLAGVMGRTGRKGSDQRRMRVHRAVAGRRRRSRGRAHGSPSTTQHGMEAELVPFAPPNDGPKRGDTSSTHSLRVRLMDRGDQVHVMTMYNSTRLRFLERTETDYSQRTISRLKGRYLLYRGFESSRCGISSSFSSRVPTHLRTPIDVTVVVVGGTALAGSERRMTTRQRDLRRIAAALLLLLFLLLLLLLFLRVCPSPTPLGFR